jgi:type III secretion protein V
MSAKEAAHLYTLLTIGDGLVSQIPALLISTAAGIVVTRVASEDEGGHLGYQIGSQVFAQSRALAVGAVLMACLALVPGLPKFAFLALAATTAALAWFLRGRDSASISQLLNRQFGTGEAELTGDEVQVPVALALEVGPDLLRYSDIRSAEATALRELIAGLRDIVSRELGILLPRVHVRSGDAALREGQYRILCHESELGRSEIAKGAVDAATQMVLYLGALVREHPTELIGIQETQVLLDRLEQTHPTLVHEVIPKSVSVAVLADILQRLLAERISIRNLRGILEALADARGADSDPDLLTEHVRAHLKRQINEQFISGERQLRALLLAPPADEWIKESVANTSRGSYLAMAPELCRELIEALRAKLAAIPADVRLVLLTSFELRRHVRQLFCVDFPALPVLSFNELLPTTQVEVIGHIGRDLLQADALNSYNSTTNEP